MNKFKKISLLSVAVMTGLTGVLCGSSDMKAYAAFAGEKTVDIKRANISSEPSNVSGMVSKTLENGTVTPSQISSGYSSSDFDIYTSNGLQEFRYVFWESDEDNPERYSIQECLINDGTFFKSGLSYTLRSCCDFTFNSSFVNVTGTNVYSFSDDDASYKVYEKTFTVNQSYLTQKGLILFYAMHVSESDDLANVRSNWSKYCGNGHSNMYGTGFYELLSPATLSDGGTKDLYYSVDANTSQETIVGGVSAKDLFGADVDVSVNTSDYVSGKVGNYTIVLQATDSYGQTATATLYIHVVDRTSPVISKKSDISVRYGSSLSKDDVLSHYSITDNVDTAFTYTWSEPANFKWETSLAFGNYTIGLVVKDTAGNTTSVNIPVNVYDDVPPTIVRKDGGSDVTLIYGYSTSYALTLEKILALFSASDTVSGGCDVYVKSGNIDTSVGDHSIIIASKDGQGNEAVKTVNYHIQADIPPVFILSDSLVQCTSDIKLSVNDLTALVASIVESNSTVSMKLALRPRMSDKATNIIINEDDYAAYVANYDKAGGTYQVRYTYDDANGQVQSGKLNISIVGETETKKIGFFEQISNFWNTYIAKPFTDFFTKSVPEFFQKLGNWITFKGFKTNAEVQAAKDEAPASSDAAESSVAE